MSISSSVQVNNIKSNGDILRENLNHNNEKNDTRAVAVQVKSLNTYTVNQAPNRPVAVSEIEVYNIVNVAGIRPITSSNLQVFDIVNVAGLRPIAASDVKFSDTITLIGDRTIALSNLNFSQTIPNSGVRPIASNEIEDYAYLMGFID